MVPLVRPKKDFFFFFQVSKHPFLAKKRKENSSPDDSLHRVHEIHLGDTFCRVRGSGVAHDGPVERNPEGRRQDLAELLRRQRGERPVKKTGIPQQEYGGATMAPQQQQQQQQQRETKVEQWWRTRNEFSSTGEFGCLPTAICG